jgi:protein involved in sex pheromone biosynthesis
MFKKILVITTLIPIFSGCISQIGQTEQKHVQKEKTQTEKPVERIHDYSIKGSSQSETNIVSKPLPDETPKEKKKLDEIEAMIKKDL